MMREWYDALSQRERVMVLACGGFIIFALLWSAGVQPLLAGAAAMEERVVTKRAQLANFQELASQAQAATTTRAGGATTVTSESIVLIIDRTTRERQLAGYLKRNQPEGTASVRLRLEGAPFDDLVSWLGELKQRYGMTAVNANFDAAGPGRVNCSLVLRRAGA